MLERLEERSFFVMMRGDRFFESAIGFWGLEGAIFLGEVRSFFVMMMGDRFLGGRLCWGGVRRGDRLVVWLNAIVFLRGERAIVLPILHQPITAIAFY
jgi:hypothetical protein